MRSTKFLSTKGSAVFACTAIFCAMLMFAVCDGNGNSDEGGNNGGSTGDGGGNTNFTPGSQFNPAITYGSLTDTRDGKTYRTVKIGNQTWMAENLNYDVSGSVCNDNDPSNCNIYGRLYYWETAMNDAVSSDASPSGVQGVCPVGWHIPSDAEWTTLIDYVGGRSTAGTKLKARAGWDNLTGGASGNGTNDYGFSALPGGGGYSTGFDYVGDDGRWWGVLEKHTIYMNKRVGSVTKYNAGNGGAFSVRCAQD